MADELLLPLLGLGENDSSSDSVSSISDVDSDWESRTGDETGEHPFQPNVNTVSYDRSLPALHSYLGTDLEEVNGRTILEDGLRLRLPLLVLPNVVLMPGQTLPLQIFHRPTVRMIQSSIDKDHTFGLINESQVDNATNLPKPGTINTTVEIRSFKQDDDEQLGFTLLRVLAEGRQRFRVEVCRRQCDANLIADVSILREVILNDSLEGALLPSLQRLGSNRSPESSRKSIRAISRSSSSSSKEQQSLSKKRNRLSMCANLTQWPAFVYDQYNCILLMQKIRTEIQSWLSYSHLDTSPKDPVDFSYWVASNIPIDDGLKIGLLKLNSAIQRLRAELSILKRCNLLRCRHCNEQIAEKKDVFSMSLKGPQGTYVNPHGYVHDTLTVHHAAGLHLVGRRSIEHSWFPGYSWTIAECHSCSKHMGWKFHAVDKKMKPEKFWGLTRSSLLSGMEQNESESVNWSPCF